MRVFRASDKVKDLAGIGLQVLVSKPASDSETLSTGLDLPGTSGNYLSVPDSANLDITGDLAVMFDGAVSDWTPPTGQGTGFVAKFGLAGNRSWNFVLAANTGGFLRLQLSADGSAISTATADAAPTVVDGAFLCVGFAWRASDGRVQFFEASSGTTTHPGGAGWSQVGTDKTAAVGAIFNSTKALSIGGDPDLSFTGQRDFGLMRVRVWASIDGTDERFDRSFVGVTVNGTRDPSSVVDAAKGATVTINGAEWDWTTS